MLAKALDEPTAAELARQGVEIVRKPIAGTALGDVLFESSAFASNSKLVSYAA